MLPVTDGDIFNLPTVRPHTVETSGLGAAMNVAVGLGHFRDYESALDAMTRPGETFIRMHFMYVHTSKSTGRSISLYERLQPLYRCLQMYLAADSRGRVVAWSRGGWAVRQLIPILRTIGLFLEAANDLHKTIKYFFLVLEVSIRRHQGAQPNRTTAFDDYLLQVVVGHFRLPSRIRKGSGLHGRACRCDTVSLTAFTVTEGASRCVHICGFPTNGKFDRWLCWRCRRRFLCDRFRGRLRFFRRFLGAACKNECESKQCNTNFLHLYLRVPGGILWRRPVLGSASHT